MVLFALSFGVKAQSWTPIFGKQRFASGLGIPTKDSTYFAGAADSSLIYINPKDAGLYYKYKGYHKKVGTGTVSSVGLTMPSAFSVSGSPITNNGSFIVTGAGSITQYIRGDGSLATFAGAPGTLPVGGTAGQILSKIDGTNYNTQWIDNYSTQIKNDVKLGATLSKGTPVYVSSANGTNMIVSASSYDTEATSSKTFGLLETGGVTNDQVRVVTYGLLAGLNTSTATAGDPVWLGLNGALIYGYANKPSAPYHMVFIGIVTRVQSNNGEIFVNVQNGFELDELHNVAAKTPSNNDGLFYESSTSLWKNKSIATVLGYTPEQPLTFSSPLSRSINTVSIPAATGSVNGYLSSTDWTTFNSKEPAIMAGTTAQYWRGDKSWQTLNTTAVAEGTNLYYTDARARAAISGTSPISVTSGVVSISQANGTTNGYLSSTDWTTFNSKQTALNGTGFVKASGTTISYDNTAYLPTTLTTTANTILINGQQFSIYGSTAGVYTSGRIIVDNGFSGLGYQVSGLFRGLSFDTSGNAWFDNTGSVRFYNSSVRFDGTLTNGTYTYTLPSATGTLALTSNLSAYVPYTGATGAVNLGAYDLTVNSIKVGKGGGAIADNTSVGALALNANTTGGSNTAIGYYALNANTIGGANTAIGYSSLWVNTTGGNNTAVGYNALSSNTTGGSNTALGQGSLSSNSTGANNVAVGLQSLLSNTTASNNSALGNQSLFYNTTGYSNVAVGYQSLLGNTTGRNNTAIGVGSGQYITTGILNTIVGSYGGTTTMSNNVILSDGSGNIRFQFDGTNTILGQSGNVGIGINSPGNPLTVSSAIGYGAEFYRNNNADSRINITNTTTTNGGDKGLMLGEIGTESYVYNYANGQMIFGTNSTERMRITNTGNLLINTTTDDNLGLHPLQVSGLARATQWRSYANGQDVAYGGGFYQQSTSGTTYAVASLMGTSGQLRWWTYNPTNGFNNYMTLTNGGNLLLNTTTDAGYKLDVNGYARFGGTNTYNGFIIGTHSNNVGAAIYTKGLTNQTLYADNSSTVLNAESNLYLRTGNTDRVTISSSNASFSGSLTTGGNLAIGTATLTPSSGSLFQLGSNTIVQNVVSTQTMFSQNAYYNSGWTYLTTGTAQAIRFSSQVVGDISFHSVASGTAGAGISNWDGSAIKMYIAPSGNVGIGTTSPGAPLEIRAGSGANYRVRANGTNVLLLQNYNDTDFYQDMQFAASTLIFNTGTAGGNSSSERMRITSGGNVLIGTTTDNGFKLQVSGQMSASAGIYSYGGVLNSIGTASNSIGSGPYLSIVNSSNSYQILQQLNASYNLDFWSYRGGWSNVSRIDGSTGIYMALSDKTKKKDFEESNIGLAEVMQLKPMLFRMKSDDANSNKQLGFLAQDVKNIIPQAYVEQDNFIGLQDRPIIAALTKAIQELNQKITNLEAQIKQ